MGAKVKAKAEPVRTLRWRLHDMLDPAARPQGLSLANKLLVAAILIAAGLAVAETEPDVEARYARPIMIVEGVLAGVFTVEYLVRFWCAAEIERLGGGWKGRLRWMVTPAALLDLAATLPALLSVGQGPTFLLRLARLMRLARIAKLGRFSKSYRILGDVVWSRRYELGATLSVGAVVLILVSSLLYLVEGQAQPDKFGSIPRALWWGIVTLTTIGYGDAYPITPLGKVLAGMTALLGIGLVAAPTGILAASFAEALRKEP